MRRNVDGPHTYEEMFNFSTKEKNQINKNFDTQFQKKTLRQIFLKSSIGKDIAKWVLYTHYSI